MSGKRHGCSGRAWQKLCNELKRTRPPVCRRCGDRIDLTLPWWHKQAWTAGHIIDVHLRPDLALELANIAPEHRTCNSSAGATVGNRLRNSRARRTSLTW